MGCDLRIVGDDIEFSYRFECSRAAGPLAGVPVGIKELYDIAGQPTTSSSRVRANWMAESDSASVAQLREAGAVILGKANLLIAKAVADYIDEQLDRTDCPYCLVVDSGTTM